jgi:teichuronic acid biosynthesis glycosyltransferase TuaG
MNQYPLVSILISAYNAESFLIPTIQSVLQQTYQNIELLILDDASTDNTYQLKKQFHNPKIKRYKSDINLWPYRWLNYLLEKATGEYIAIQDHDDFWHREKLKKQIHFLEKNKKYIWCGTKTLMRYEWDQKWFEYYLWKENYYTIHPSLVFRNQWYRYPEDRIYMNDAYFQKKVLCDWKKNIYNINETLTFHRIKSGVSNFSYKWFRYSWVTINTVFTLHPVWYSICIIWWETMRKIVYPVLQVIDKERWIYVLEKRPFEMMGNKMEAYPIEKLNKIWF